MQKMKNSEIEWIGEIPDGWETMRIQFCLDEIVVKNSPIQTTQVLSLMKDKGVMLYEEKGDIGNKAKEDYSEYKIAYPNTLIVNSMNILIGSVGISQYFGCVSPIYYVFKETELSCIRFINYIFNTTAFQKELRRYANGILEIRLRVSSNDIFKRKIPLPPKSLQIEIANFLNEKCAKIERLIAHEEATIEELKAYKQSVITEAVTKGLDITAPMKDSGVEWIGEIPESWGVNRIKYTATYNDETISEKTDLDTEIQYVDIGSVSFENGIEKIEKFIFRTAPSRARRITKKGDIIVSTVRTYLKAIAMVKNDGLIVSTGFCVLRPYKLLNKYVEYFCKSNIFTDNVSRYSVGISYPAINATDLVGFVVCQPPNTEQRQIADYLDKKCADIDMFISIKQQKIEELKEYKKSLIYEYVTGKKEVA